VIGSVEFTRNFDLATGAPVAPSQKRNMVEFMSQPIEDVGASAAAGRPVFIDRTIIRIIVPGDSKSIVERLAQAEDKLAYPGEWAAFERQEKFVSEGTSLDAYPPISRAVVRNLKNANVFTVEQLAGLSDLQCQQIGILGLRSMRAVASAWLETAKTGAAPVRLVTENEQLMDRVKHLEAELSAANQRYESLLRSTGADPSAISARATAPASPVAAPAPAPAPAPVAPVAPAPVKPAIPENYAKLPDKELFALVKSTTGMVATSRKVALEVMKDVAGE
jgi:hypothetical protein